jgi:hypothetical protein
MSSLWATFTRNGIQNVCLIAWNPPQTRIVTCMSKQSIFELTRAFLDNENEIIQREEKREDDRIQREEKREKERIHVKKNVIKIE